MTARTMLSDARVLVSLLRGLPRNGAHAERLQRFYGPQAGKYDDFRERLLHGRKELVDLLPAAAGQRIVELGGGTGRNLEFFGPRLRDFASVHVVDLCQPLLDLAAMRFAGIANVHPVQADATSWRPDAPVDCVFFAYALSMIPDWRRAIDNAVAMLKPGGILGAVDFYVSDARPQPGRTHHGWLARELWARWFRHDGVMLSPAPLAWLQERTDTVHLDERSGRIPYMAGLKAPYYVFVGRKPDD